VRGEAAIRSGLELATLHLLTRSEMERPSHGEVEAVLGPTRVHVAYRAETARVDLNVAPKELIAGLFSHLGWPDAASKGFADRILGWRTLVQPNAPNPEPAAYRAAGLGYLPRQGAFNSILELGLVLGLPPDLPARAQPYVTIYSGRAEVNVAEADPVVVASLPGLAGGPLAAVLAARATGASGKDLLDLMGSARERATTDAGQAFRAEIEVWLRNRRFRAEVVFTLNSDALNPYEILYWKDDFDGPPSLS
jgi:general secretion pathway protein K